MPKLTIDGVTAEVPEGTPIIAAADGAGVPIQRFCYHPDLKPAGNCRICQVEVEGNPRLTVACMTAVKDGMVVRTDTEKVKKAVQGDLEMLLVNHPVDCPICDQAGECYLQDYYMQVGLHESRMPLADKLRKKKLIDLGNIILDRERCVLCSRCIRFSDDVTGTYQMGFFNRGSHMEIGTFRDRPIEDAYSGCYADVCPVGALTAKDFRFQSRVWFLEQADSVCPECSTGCNIRIDHREGRIFRILPRRNPEVNRSWMCDEGRAKCRDSASGERLLAPSLNRSGTAEEVGWPAALGEIAQVIRSLREAHGPAALAGIATPRASLEELWLFRRLIRDTLGSPHLDFRVDPAWRKASQRADQLLRRQDPHANTRGAELLGIGPGAEGEGVEGILEGAAAGRIRLLYLLGPELLICWPDRGLVERALAGSSYVVLHDTRRRPAHPAVHALLPAAALVERDGSFANHASRVQRFQRAFRPPGHARPALEVLDELDAMLRGEAPTRPAARQVFRHIASAVPAFAGLSHERLGPGGAQLGGEATGGGETT